MSDIVDRLRNPKRALWYCREFSRGDDESLDIQEAADEIERLRGLLREVRARFPAGFHDAELMDRISAALAGTADQLHWSSGDPSVTITPQGEMSVDPQCPACGRSTKRHPGYIIGNHWLESAYERICAGEAEDDVLRDYDVVRVTNQPKACAAKDCCIEVHGAGTCATCGRTASPTPAALSPAQLEAANLGLANESVRLQEALRFYAEREHIVFTDEAEEGRWEPGSDPEAPNWMDRLDLSMMIEDGGVAREALKPFEVTADPTTEVQK